MNRISAMLGTQNSINFKAGVTSRYLSQEKKKYNLGGNSSNLDKLKTDQMNELNTLLVSLKSEFDNLVRETIYRKSETEKLGKQIKMMEKIEKKSQSKVSEAVQNNEGRAKNIEIKKEILMQEQYEKATLQGLYDRLQSDLQTLNKGISQYESDNKKVKKLIEKEKLTSTALNEKVNQLYNKAKKIERKSSMDKNEQALVLQYYHTIIENKWSFIRSSDERKEKQMKISLDAKLDTQDKSEVDNRRILMLTNLYNKYLKKRMLAEIRKNDNLEMIYQSIKKITNQSDLNGIVHTILNRDKNYNLTVSRVTECETKLEITRKKIEQLKQNIEDLKNEIISQDEITEQMEKDQVNHSMNASFVNNSSFLGGEDEEDTRDEEQILIEELHNKRALQENIRLKSEQVFDNLKLLIYNNEEKQSMRNTQVSEDNLIGGFTMYLNKTKESLDSLFLNYNKEEHFEKMKTLAMEREKIQNENTHQDFSKKARRTTLENANYNKSMPNIKVIGIGEYDYTPDNEVVKDEEEIKKEVNDIIVDYKNKIKLEKLKEEAEKKKK